LLITATPRSLRRCCLLDIDRRAYSPHSILLLYLPDQPFQIRSVSQWLRIYHLYAITRFFGWREGLVYFVADISPQYNGLPVEEWSGEYAVGRVLVALYEKVGRDGHLGLAQATSGHGTGAADAEMDQGTRYLWQTSTSSSVWSHCWRSPPCPLLKLAHPNATQTTSKLVQLFGDG
jgi:hypothetical protein